MPDIVISINQNYLRPEYIQDVRVTTGIHESARRIGHQPVPQTIQIEQPSRDARDITIRPDYPQGLFGLSQKPASGSTARRAYLDVESKNFHAPAFSSRAAKSYRSSAASQSKYSSTEEAMRGYSPFVTGSESFSSGAILDYYA
jgi:hypothetical protein